MNVGTATVTVKGKGNFTGTAKGTFRIVKQDNMETLVKKRLDEMMEGKWDRRYMTSGTAISLASITTRSLPLLVPATPTVKQATKQAVPVL